MRKLKTFSDAMVKKLNDACDRFMSEGCDMDCLGIGWCEDCWHEIDGDITQPADNASDEL